MRTVFYMLRLPNLLMIALTFLILRYFVFFPVYSTYSFAAGMKSFDYLLMVISTILIAAAGYVSNDFFDIVTDGINKPEKLYIGKKITPDSALSTALLLSILATLLAIWLSLTLKSFVPAFLLITALLVAWWYAIKLKKSLLWGNIAVACMTGGTISMAWLIERLHSHVQKEPDLLITRIVIAISAFAFLLSLLREIVKDMEDTEGDKLINCRSLPIVKGITFTKGVIVLLTSITLILLIIAQISLFRFSLTVAALWLFAMVEVPLLLFIFLLRSAREKIEFHRLSTLLKLIMLGGILTIIAGQF
jgi:4-hydroxybenzoate polyprenyltransferase